MTLEVWRTIAGYEGRYEVSNHGRVRSLSRLRFVQGKPFRISGRVLKSFVDTTTKYLCVNLCDGTRAKKYGVHVLVLEAFVSPRPDGLWGLHGDGNRQNPALSNLRWGTPSDNTQDAILHGTMGSGEKSGGAVLTNEFVGWIRESKQSSLALAPVFGVASSTIRAVRIGQNWASQ